MVLLHMFQQDSQFFLLKACRYVDFLCLNHMIEHDSLHRPGTPKNQFKMDVLVMSNHFLCKGWKQSI